jgi:hypothetical protein
MGALLVHEKEGKGAIRRHTMFIIPMLGYMKIDDTQEPLISSLELALIKDLNCDD